jgi:hypothetical protein
MMQTPPTEPSNSSPMTVDEARAWAATWHRAAPELAKERRARSRTVPLCNAIEALDDAFEAALASHGTRQTSGFVEQQRLFARFRNAGPACKSS